ncbi:MAG: hypothetical protein RLZZ479_252 [Bacteroidota bacterium]|jgi:hypothetical protein
MNKFTSILSIILGGFGLMILVMVILGFPTLFLWNWLMPSIFGLKQINFWEAVGLQLFIWIFTPVSKSSAVKNDE